MDQAGGAATLTELASEAGIFALGMRERAADAKFADVHQGAIRLMEEFETTAKRERFDHTDIADAKFALAAFIDEVVLSAEWPGREQWAEDPLQLHYFGTYLAGEDFFERLDALRSHAGARTAALGVYHQCLLLGFKGKYGIAEREKLESLKRAVQSELEREAKNSGDPPLHWQPSDQPSAPSDGLPRWFVYACLAVLGLCVMTYALLFYTVRADAPDETKAAERSLHPTSAEGTLS